MMMTILKLKHTRTDRCRQVCVCLLIKRPKISPSLSIEKLKVQSHGQAGKQEDRKRGRGGQTVRQTGSPAVLLITQTGPRAHKSHKFQLSAYPWKINVNLTMQSRSRPCVLCCLLPACRATVRMINLLNFAS